MFPNTSGLVTEHLNLQSFPLSCYFTLAYRQVQVFPIDYNSPSALHACLLTLKAPYPLPSFWGNGLHSLLYSDLFHSLLPWVLVPMLYWNCSPCGHQLWITKALWDMGQRCLLLASGNFLPWGFLIWLSPNLLCSLMASWAYPEEGVLQGSPSAPILGSLNPLCGQSWPLLVFLLPPIYC